MYAAEIEAEEGKGEEEKVLTGLHSTFAMVLMGSGVPALVFLVWALVRMIQELAFSIRQAGNGQTGFLPLGPAIALSVVGFAVRNTFDDMFAGSLATLFWVLIAAGLNLASNSQLVREGPSATRPHD